MLEQYNKRVEDLLSKMTLKEKIGQLNQPETPTVDNVEKIKEQIRRGEIGSILMSVGATAGNDAQGSINISFYNELQRIAVEESPNKIPIIYGRDVIHGHHTVYPIPLAMAASFNFDLIEECYRDIAKEAANDSVHWSFAPMLDVARDPRWGRIIEGPGEDPLIGACMAKSVVKGFQGDELSSAESVLACAKHFIGYGAAEGGRDYNHTEISDYNLYNYYVPAFRSAIEAGALTVMSSFNDINGQPVTSGRFYLTDVLRNNMKFNGFVVSDYAAISQLKHCGVAETDAEASLLAIDAGVDMDMYDYCYLNELEKLVENGSISIDVIDNAVRNVLRVKFAKGLFENPYCNVKAVDYKPHLKNARKLAAESMVLLKNDNNILPLKKSSKVSLMGPFANEKRSLLGSWCLDGKIDMVTTLEEAMRGKLEADGRVYVRHKTCELLDNSLWVMNRSDAIVLALGESWGTTGENRSVSDVTITVQQKELIKNAKSTGKKVIGVFFCGRPIAMQDIAHYFDAILYAWHSGTETANAVADILYGDVVPSGRTPVTFPRLSTHIPVYYNCFSSGHEVNAYYGENSDVPYVDSLASPYYPFGYGLSYTRFKYGEIRCKDKTLSILELKNGKHFEVSIDIENIGGYDAKETVQLYIHDVSAKMMRPLRELKAFKKVFIKQAEKVTVSFRLGFKELGYYDSNGVYDVESGNFEVYIGENSLTRRQTTIVLK